jgi:hypothetical protein
MYHSIGPSLHCVRSSPSVHLACLSTYRDTMPYGGYFKCTFLHLFKKLKELVKLDREISIPMVSITIALTN